MPKTRQAQRSKLYRGARLGKYRLQKLLGEGTFAQVWQAHDCIEARRVALKIPSQVAPGSEAETELLSEIALGSGLEHPNVLQIRSADRIDGFYVLCTDLAIESLEERLRRRLATAKALSMIEQILRGLAYSHAQRIIHRDLKPSNILLFPCDLVRIADLSLAKRVRGTMFSATGSGTVPYVAPEQAHGRPCLASDVFSMGLISHQILTGTPAVWPFAWPFPREQLLRAKAPPELIRIIRKASHVDHRRRYHDATEMLDAFVRIEGTIERFIRPPVRKRRRRKNNKVAWRALRFRECERAYGKHLMLRFNCPTCGGPISEHMPACPWCGEREVAFAEETEFPAYCDRCRRGLLDEWRYCPWCWGPAFSGASGQVHENRRYDAACRRCGKPMIHGMRYCPWCHAKPTRSPRLPALPDACPQCKGSVTVAFWEHCPWCGGGLEARP